MYTLVILETGKQETGRNEVQGYLWLHIKFEDDMFYMFQNNWKRKYHFILLTKLNWKILRPVWEAICHIHMTGLWH